MQYIGNDDDEYILPLYHSATYLTWAAAAVFYQVSKEFVAQNATENHAHVHPPAAANVERSNTLTRSHTSHNLVILDLSRHTPICLCRCSLLPCVWV